MTGLRTPSRLALGVLLLAAVVLPPALGHGVCLLHVAPLVAIVLPLLRGRYVGEERIARMRAAAPVARRVPAPVVALVRTGRARVVRGGRLVAAALAQRGPPVLS